MPKKAIEVYKKNYEERLTCFKNGFCPYCGSPATLTEGKTGKWTGVCSTKKHTNHFTNQKAIEKVIGG